MTIDYSGVDVFPYQIGNGEKIGTPLGLSIEIITQAAKDIGVNVVFSRFPSKRVLLCLTKAEIDRAGIYSFKKTFESGLCPMKNCGIELVKSESQKQKKSYTSINTNLTR